nr:right-handed parallel beta-helix repeat-containing protein [Mucilaginibacter sp. Bleaf8]
MALTGCRGNDYIEKPATPNPTIPEKAITEATATAVNVNTLGIYGDGKTDFSSRIQEALNTYPSLYFPEGNYLISKTLSLNFKQNITGTDNTVFSTSGNGFPKNAESCFFSAAATDHIQLTRLSFTGINDKSRAIYALLVNGGCNDVKLNKLSAQYCGLIRSKLNDLPYNTIASGDYNLNTNLSIDSCTATGTSGSGMGIYLAYVKNWKISHCALANYRHGIEWWGGDSNPARDGSLTKPRLASNGVIDGVTVNHITEGGIWGSMGNGIVVQNCKVNDCGDVGIDFEGCFNSRATGNTVSNCRNGALATFFYNKNITFSGNTVTQDDPAATLACIYNATQLPDNKDIAFTNNNFRATKGVGVIKQLGPADTILFANNSLVNVVLNLTFNNNRRVRITGNQFKITEPTDRYDFVIKAGETNSKGIVTIDRNTITCSASGSRSVYGIYTTQSDYNSQPVNYLTENSITGVKTRYRMEWNGKNAGVNCKTYLQTTQAVLPDDILKVDNGNSISELYVNNKRH